MTKKYRYLTISLLFYVVFLAGCATGKLYKQGQELELAGHPYDAAQKYLAALARDAEHEKSQVALKEVAERAYQEQLGIAVEYERVKNYRDAINQYQSVKQFLEGVKKHKAQGFTAINVAQKLEDLANTAAEERYLIAEDLVAKKSWNAAIDEYRKALGFNSNYKDTKAKIAEAYYNWAGDDLAARKFREAADKYGKSVEYGGAGFRDAGKRISVIFAALGEYHLDNKSCRQAVLDLRVAQRQGGNSQIDENLQKAIDCATLTISIKAFDDRTKQDVGGLDLGSVFAERIGAAIASKASEFVKLIDRSALASIEEEQRLSVSGVSDGEVAKLKGVRFFVNGNLTQVLVTDEPPKTTKQVIDVEESYKCTQTNSAGQVKEAVCWRNAKLTYDSMAAKREVKIALSVKGTDVRGGQQFMTEQFSGIRSDSNQWAENAVYQSTGVAVNMQAVRGSGVDALKKQISSKRSLKEVPELAEGVIDEIVKAAASRIVSAIDKEPKSSDPASLKLEF